MIDPLRIYEVAGQVCALLRVHGEYAAGLNQTVLAGITGKRIRIMGYQCQSITGTASGFAIKDGAAGARLTALAAPPNTVLPYLAPITESGYFETSTGSAIGLDVGGGAPNMNLTIFYIAYTP
jgi:hypothetical protein